MYPNQQQNSQTPQPQAQQPMQQYQQPADGGGSYLDQIAAPQQQKTINPMQLWLFIGGGLLLLIGLFALMIGAGGSQSPAEQLQSVSDRVEAMRTLTTDKASTIKSSDLRATNSSLSTVLTTISTAVGSYTNPSGEKKKKEKDAPLTPVEAEFKELGTRLEDAELNVEFDQTYAHELEFQVKTLQAEMKVSYDKTKDAELQQALDEGYTSLDSIVKSLQSLKNLAS